MLLLPHMIGGEAISHVVSPVVQCSTVACWHLPESVLQ